LTEPSIVTTPADAAVSLLEARYQDGSAPPPTQWSPVLETLLAHHSVRKYLPTALPAGTLELLVAAAQSASTSSNLQSWSVVAVEDPARKAHFAELCGNQKHVAQCPLFLIWLADLGRANSLGREREAVIAAIDYTDIFLASVVDAALAAQNAVATAESLGLGTVYIGGIRNHIETVASDLNLPPMVTPVFGLCVGYPDPSETASVKPRLPQAAVLHRETYSWPAQQPAIAAYDQTLKAYFDRQGMQTGGWIKSVISRLRGIEQLTGRHGLKDSFRKFGFALK
jgi:nitroreductase